jgi:hypothetical protein
MWNTSGAHNRGGQGYPKSVILSLCFATTGVKLSALWCRTNNHLTDRNWRRPPSWQRIENRKKSRDGVF